MKRALLAVTIAVSLAGCTGNCLKLAQKICECQATSTLRDQCKQQASNLESQVSVSSSQEQTCGALIDKCDCHALDTELGKQNCGLARIVKQ